MLYRQCNIRVHEAFEEQKHTENYTRWAGHFSCLLEERSSGTYLFLKVDGFNWIRELQSYVSCAGASIIMCIHRSWLFSPILTENLCFQMHHELIIPDGELFRQFLDCLPGLTRLWLCPDKHTQHCKIFSSIIVLCKT